MNIYVICVGKLKEKYWNEALSEYRKRLSKYCNLLIEELKEERLPDNASLAQEEAVKEEEGKALSSEGLAQFVKDLGIKGRSDVAFIIGGSLGLSQGVLDRSDLRLSFSKMTFPHQMMRVILLEQLYRSFKINRNEVYHK